MTNEEVLLPARLVALLREDAIFAVHETAERLKLVAIETAEREADRQAADAELWHLDAARRLIEKVGISQGPISTAVRLTAEDHPVLILRLFRARVTVEIGLGEAIAPGTRNPHRERVREIEEFLDRLEAGLCVQSGEIRREELHIVEGHHPDLPARRWP